MEREYYLLKVIFTTPVLGSQPTGRVASEFLAKRAGFENGLPEDEEQSLPEALEKGTTVFHRSPEGAPIFFNYQIKGFLKNAGLVLNGMVKNQSGAVVKALRSKVNNKVFVIERCVELHPPGNNGAKWQHEDITYNERPLRAATAQGERVALARSEQLPEGTWFTCKLAVYPGDIDQLILEELLDYGFDMGLGQWRNGGWGQFRYELAKA